MSLENCEHCRNVGEAHCPLHAPRLVERPRPPEPPPPQSLAERLRELADEVEELEQDDLEQDDYEY